MKKCSFCAEEIQDEAIVCRHCGRALTSEEARWREWANSLQSLDKEARARRWASLSSEQKQYVIRKLGVTPPPGVDEEGKKSSVGTKTLVGCGALLGSVILMSVCVALVNPPNNGGLSSRVAQTDSSREQTEAPEADKKVKPAASPETVISDITFVEVDNKFGLDSNFTKLQKKEEWKKYKGKCVQWEGQLVHLDEGLLGGIDLGFKHRSDTLTYDVLVSGSSALKQQALQMKLNAHYSYKATLKSYGGAILPISADFGCN